jgi:hypothetical protein
MMVSFSILTAMIMTSYLVSPDIITAVSGKNKRENQEPADLTE